VRINQGDDCGEQTVELVWAAGKGIKGIKKKHYQEVSDKEIKGRKAKGSRGGRSKQGQGRSIWRQAETGVARMGEKRKVALLRGA